MNNKDEFKSGFVGIIGRPNVGKSTLINSFVDEKIAITSDKPQTTRNKIRCIVNRKNAQIIFIDTPGFHKPKDPLGKYLNQAVESTFREVDAIVFVADASEIIGRGDAYIANQLKKINTPVILVLNKIDKIGKNKLKSQIEAAKERGRFTHIIPLSAKTKENIIELLDSVCTYMPAGPKYYSDDMVTDQPEALIISEFIREKVLNLTSEEVPYSVAVEINEIEARPNKDLTDVFATIYVERDSQKGILIGKGGTMLKKVGQQARFDIEKLLGNQINLQLYVKVKKNWRRDERTFQQFGYNQ